MQDLLYLDKVIKYKSKKDLYNDYFCWLYPFTNENINGYYSKIEFNNKDVLTVTSSGDHALNALSFGAKDICSFDSNPLAKYYSELKIAGIKTLELDEFLLFFYNKNLFKKQVFYLNKDTYNNRLRTGLDDRNKNFWDSVFNLYNYNDLYKSNLFSFDFLSKKGLLETELYLDRNKYLELRDILKEKSIKYYDINIQNLNNINKKFDLIILSNIVARINDEDVLNKLKILDTNLKKLLNNNGKIVLNYYYSNLLHPENKDLVYDFDKLKDIFSKYEQEILTIESSLNLERNKILKNYLSKDKVLVLKK